MINAKQHLKLEPEQLFLHLPNSFFTNHPSIQHENVCGTVTLYEHQINKSSFTEQGNWQIKTEILKHFSIYLITGFIVRVFFLSFFLSIIPFFFWLRGMGGSDIYPLDYEHELNTSVIKPALFELTVINVQPLK
jgi:hypothetical protein